MTAGWSAAGYAEVADLVRERTGLVFPEARVRDVEATIQRAMARRRIGSLDALVDVLRENAEVREEFVADLTVGESYFMRDPAQFDLLRSHILPELLEAHGGRPLRVWSAACAAGEEPYSIAMLLEELDAADRSDIVGTDIARSRLQEAQRGIFSRWQLRGVPEITRRRYFAERGRYFELSPRIRQLVDFRYLNLAEDSFPSLTTGIWGMDVIVCRNVLIYFDAPTVALVARRLIASLSEDGWLILGASDPGIADLVDCDVVLTDAGLVYRRRGAAESTDIRADAAVQIDDAPRDSAPVAPAFDSVDKPAAGDTGENARKSSPVDDVLAAEREQPAGATVPADAVAALDLPAPEPGGRDAALIEAYGRRDFAAVREIGEALERTGGMTPVGWTVRVRSLANEGCLDDAAALIGRALAAGESGSELLYLHAVLLLQVGRAEDAAAAARRALYLDRGLVVGHLTLGEARRRMGDREGAQRALRNAAKLLDGMDPQAVVVASDGESAGRLRELVRVKLKLLGAGR